jgi:serine phosphatase RsbU (regulator of sigma subunit)
VKKILFILFIIPTLLLGNKIADKNHYLIDSLVFEDLSQFDQNLLDSCLSIYHNSEQDTIKIEALNIICDNLVSDVWSDYQFVLDEILNETLAKELTTEERYVLEVVKGGSLNNIGLFYEFQKGNSSKALGYYLKALKLFKKIENKHGEAMLLNRVGTIYTNQDNIEKGYEYYKKSLALYKSLDEQDEIANPMNNLGSYYKDKQDYTTALFYYKQSLEIDVKVNNRQGAATLYSNIGGVYTVLKRYDKALISFIKGLIIFEEMGDKSGIAMILTHIGQVHYEQGDYESAFVNANRSFKIAKEDNYYKRLNSSAFLLSKIFEEQEKPEKALDMYKLYTATKDSMTNENTKSSAVRQQTQYEYESQKAIDDAVYSKELARQQEAKEKQQIIIYAIGFGLTLLAAFLIFVFNRLRLTRRQKSTIELQKKNVEAAHLEVSEKNKEILDSINYAKRIQKAILPNHDLVKQYLMNSFVLFKPKDIVAGDFYWMEASSSFSSEEGSANSSLVSIDDKCILFAAADCTGHGVPGAMVSVVCNNALNRSVREYGLTDPGKILDKTREIVISEFSDDSEVNNQKEDYVKDGMDIALCSLTGSTLKYAGANNPLWIVRDGELIERKADKQPIGSFRSQVPFTTHEIELKKNDALYIFSDGYADQFGGEKGKKFMTKAVKKLLLSIQDKSMDIQRSLLNEAFENWRGNNEQVDDVCFIGVRI